MTHKRIEIIDGPPDDPNVLRVRRDEIVAQTRAYFADRSSGLLKGLAWFLDPDYRWEVVLDDEGAQCLVRLKR